MNDEINKLMREKGHWERRIVELSGPDYSVIGFSPRHFFTLTRLLDGRNRRKLQMMMACKCPEGEEHTDITAQQRSFLGLRSSSDKNVSYQVLCMHSHIDSALT